MSWLDRRTFLALPFALSACGFRPANSPGGGAGRLRGHVLAADPGDRNGFDFVGRIEERLGRPEAPLYQLTYTIQTDLHGVGLTARDRTTRQQLTGQVDYVLKDITTGSVITSGQVHSFTGYAATGSTIAGLAAEEDAARRLMRILADQIVTRLLASAANGG